MAGIAFEEERVVLMVGDDLARIDPFISSLRRAAFSVRRAPALAAILRLIRDTPFDMIVVVLPFAPASDVLKAARAGGSNSRTALVVVADGALGPDGTEAMSGLANRVLPAASQPEDLRNAADQLLNAAPRVPVRATARLHLGAQGGEPRAFSVENISSTGMLLAGRDPPPVDSVCGFELAVPSLGAPLRGQVLVVRLTAGRRPGEHGIATNFVSFGGDGAKQLETVIFQERAATGAGEWRAGKGTTAPGGVVPIRSADELAQRREELAELEPFLEEQLQRGLGPRVKVADWYVAAAQLGLESLRDFSAVLEAVHGERARRSEVSQQLADLTDVRRSLAEFAGPKADVEARIRILMEMRHSLERLLVALASTGVSGEKEAASGVRPRGLVADLARDVCRLVHTRRYLGQLPGLILELQRPRYIFARRALRRRTEEIFRDYATWETELGLDGGERLRSRRGRRETLVRLAQANRRLDEHLATVHKRVYLPRFHSRSSGDVPADFEEAKLISVLSEILAAGVEFLARAYSAYRHALELTGTDPRLLDRVAGLSASVAEAERRVKEKKEQQP